MEPFEKTRAVVNDGMRQSGHCFLLRHLHHVVIERFGRIGRDILGFLEARVKTEQEASGIDGIARRHRHLFEQERLQAKFCCMNGTDQPAAAGTDNNEVVFGGFARFGFGSSPAAPTAPTAAVLKNSRRFVVIFHLFYGLGHPL